MKRIFKQLAITVLNAVLLVPASFTPVFAASVSKLSEKDLSCTIGKEKSSFGHDNSKLSSLR